ncbi:MAG: hypothetical protein ACK5XV_07555 [Flavobacteriales bacterium]|jgi:hypothetical protein
MHPILRYLNTPFIQAFKKIYFDHIGKSIVFDREKLDSQRHHQHLQSMVQINNRLMLPGEPLHAQKRKYLFPAINRYSMGYRMHYMAKIYLTIFALFLLNPLAKAQPATDTTKLILEFPLVDFPYQNLANKTTGDFFSSYKNPSMSQSLAMSNNLYSSAHYGINSLIKSKSRFKTRLYRNLAALGFGIFSSYIPFGNGWLHEEYHRAVMTRRGVNSFNQMNTFPFGNVTVSVNRIRDEDLIMLSDEYNIDFRRLLVAGMEGEFAQIRELQKNNFYYNQGLPNIPLYWLSTLNSISYLNGLSQYDELIDQANEVELSVDSRDFTGPDYTAWVAALFNPQRPYEERGIHPSGVGINRYIKTTDLNDDEIGYLKKQGQLHWLNVISPQLFGFKRIRLKSDERGAYYGNFAVRHVLTPFGNSISLDLFYQTPANNYFFSLHNYNNLHQSFFGIEGAIIDKKITNKLMISSRGILWTQPGGQAFSDHRANLGGAFNIRNSLDLNHLRFFLDVEAKSAGWLMGNVFLEENVSFILGFNVRIN